MASLLADENIHPLLIDALRSAGYNVALVAGGELTGAVDEKDYAEDPRLLVVLSEGQYRVRHASARPHPP